MADAVGHALLVVLDRLAPAERLAFVLHDMFAVPFEALLVVLDPDVVVRADRTAVAPGGPTEIRGAREWAKGAVAFSRQARFVQPALLDGSVGLVLAPGGRLIRALRLTIARGTIVEVDVIADPERLRQLNLGVLDD